jgi:tetratricopeptide (TPR) repeat protein
MKGTPADLRGRALLGLQQLYMAREDYASALRTGEELTALQPETEKWLIPQGLLGLGTTLMKLGRMSDARAAFNRVLTFDDYDFQKSTEEKARKEITKLQAPG